MFTFRIIFSLKVMDPHLCKKPLGASRKRSLDCRQRQCSYVGSTSLHGPEASLSIEAIGSLPCSQESTTDPCHESDEFSSHAYILFS